MGLFSGVKDNWKKSEAAVVVQNALEHMANVGFFDADPARVANQLVGAVGDSKPDVFSGRFGQRPHKVSVAVAALAHGLSVPGFVANDDRSALGLALGNLLSYLEVNGKYLPLNSLDSKLLEDAAAVFVAASDGLPEGLDQILEK